MLEIFMMSQNDGSAPESPGYHKPITVPALKSAVARRVRYRKPRRFFEQGKEFQQRDVIEIDVETDADFAVAGTGPALFVGSTLLLDSERLAERRYRFFAPGSLSFQKNAPVALSRGGSGAPPPEKRRSRIRLRWEEGSSQ
jgi:hypothetical protein